MRDIKLKTWMIAALALAMVGCDQEQPTSGAPSATGTPAKPEVTAAPPPPTAVAPTASATATPSGPVHDCPAGSTGDGTLAKPCDAKGTARMMEVTWTGKTTDDGPSFRVTNKSPSVILYGKIMVYFYDKTGNQLQVQAADGKTHPYQTCFGNIFGGVMKAAEKAVITFSCVKKSHVPEGTTAIEAEMQTVGFADESEKKSEYYWRNPDLTPDTRPKGGIKK